MTRTALNKEIFRLAIPSIVANITIPFVGMVAIAVVGHIHDSQFANATLIGGISIGSMLFDLMYWNFSFLRVGTGGLVAQAFGRGDKKECAELYGMAQTAALLSALLILLIQWLVVKGALLVVDATPQVEYLASKYFYVRVWAAPATLSLMAIKGWFIGMQDGVSPMITDIVVNVLNIILSIVLALGVHIGGVQYDGIGFIGVAAATVIAQYSGFAVGLALIWLRYRKVFRGMSLRSVLESLHGPKMRLFFKSNSDLFVRSLCFIGIYIGFKTIAAGYGDLTLATSSIMMQLMMLFSYITDGFAYAGEAMVGRFVGLRDKPMVRSTARWVFVWSFAVTACFMVAYIFWGDGMVAWLTNDVSVQQNAHQFLIWLQLMPIFGCAAFTWDGIYTGATATADMRNSMIASVVCYFGLYFAGAALYGSSDGTFGLNLLLGAYCMHLVVRTIYLSFRYRRGVLSRLD